MCKYTPILILYVRIMVRNITEAPCETDFILTVHCSIYQYPVELCISMEDTISDIKEFMGETMELFHDEMTFMISLSCPYPLPDNMKLCRLLDEHRHLILRIHEGNEECYGRSKTALNTSVPWCDGQVIPDRYLFINDNGKTIFDFRYLSSSQIPRIRSWIYSYRHIAEVWLLGTHPLISRILYSLAEDILSFVALDRIIIQHPEHESYSLPLHSESRHHDFHKDGITSHLHREELVYLYQHLLMDQYRDSVKDVSIIVHGNLLHSHTTSFRFYNE